MYEWGRGKVRKKLGQEEMAGEGVGVLAKCQRRDGEGSDRLREEGGARSRGHIMKVWLEMSK